MPTYRIRCSGRSADIVADSPQDAVARVKDMEHFQMPGSERQFQIYEILRFDKKHFAGRPMPEQQKQWYGAEEKYLETIVITKSPT
jgi:hypothetical protein